MAPDRARPGGEAYLLIDSEAMPGSILSVQGWREVPLGPRPYWAMWVTPPVGGQSRLPVWGERRYFAEVTSMTCSGVPCWQVVTRPGSGRPRTVTFAPASIAGSWPTSW